MAELDRLVAHNARYHRMVKAFERALDGDARAALDHLEGLDPLDPERNADLRMWRAVILALAGELDVARAELIELQQASPRFVEAVRRFRSAGLIDDATLIDQILP